MAHVYPDQVIRVSVAGTDLDTSWANVMHVYATYSSTPSQADLDGWLNDFSDAYLAAFLGHFYGNITVSESQATLFIDTGSVLHSELTLGDTGTSGHSPVVDSAGCKIISWNSGAYWRGGKPRTYLPGLAIEDIESGTMNRLHSTEITALVADATAFIVAVNGIADGAITGGQFCFVSFSSGGVELDPGVVHGITGAKVHPRIGTQRRRLGKWQV